MVVMKPRRVDGGAPVTVTVSEWVVQQLCRTCVVDCVLLSISSRTGDFVRQRSSECVCDKRGVSGRAVGREKKERNRHA